MKTKSKTMITKTPRIWADADSYVSTPASDALEDELDEIFVAVQRRERTLEEAFAETNDPGLALALALRHGLRSCPNWSDPARLSRALVQATTVLAARGELDDTVAWVVHRVTRLAFGDINVDASDHDLAARVLGACDEVAKRYVRLALLLELGWECHLPAARARYWARATRLLRQASVALRGEDRMLAHVLRSALPGTRWRPRRTGRPRRRSAGVGAMAECGSHAPSGHATGSASRWTSAPRVMRSPRRSRRASHACDECAAVAAGVAALGSLRSGRESSRRIARARPNESRS